MSKLPPKLQLQSGDDGDRRRRLIIWVGVGVPSLIGAALVLALGVPLWIVAIFLVVEALGIFFST